MIINLSANIENVLGVVGNNFRITDSNAQITAIFEGGQLTQKVTLERGMAFTPAGGYTRVRLLSTVDQTITLESTVGVLDDNRISGLVNVEVNSSNIVTGLAPVNFSSLAVQSIGQNVSRKELHLKAANSNIEDIYLFSIDGLTGIPLEPGQTTVLNTTALINLYCTDTTAILYCAEFE